MLLSRGGLSSFRFNKKLTYGKTAINPNKAKNIVAIISPAFCGVLMIPPPYFL